MSVKKSCLEYLVGVIGLNNCLKVVDLVVSKIDSSISN